MFRVKVVSRGSGAGWLRYFPDKSNTRLGNCQFIFDGHCNHYDWLVVYEDLPKTKDARPGIEKLSCNQENTLLVTTEPPNIKLYDKEYTQQFGHVLTSHPPECLQHPHRIYSQPALMWFCSDTDESWDFLQTDHQTHHSKHKILSTVCSNKRQKHTLHNRRYDLTMALQRDLPEMDVFGRGIRHVESKYQMMKKYRYHLAIENYQGKHHWTEKLSDCFLSDCLPFYYGCTNLSDYFPENSFIEIDLWDTSKTREIIADALANNAYEKRLEAIMEAKRRVIEEYSFFAEVNKIVTTFQSDKPGCNAQILSRHAIRRKYPFTCIPRVLKKEVQQFVKHITSKIQL